MNNIRPAGQMWPAGAFNLTRKTQIVFILPVYLTKTRFESLKTYQLWSLSTVKLGYNDHGYNELTVIANNLNLLVWSSIFSKLNFMLITKNFLKIHCYNEQNEYFLMENVIKFHKNSSFDKF